LQNPKRRLSKIPELIQNGHVRNEAQADVVKVWLYAAASVWLGAWLSPFLYNAGKAIHEVSQGKTINGLFAWLAGVCQRASFGEFFVVSLILSAALLFLPWMEWMRARRGIEQGGGPWALRLPDGARVWQRGQPLVKNPRGWWQLCTGFLLIVGLLVPMSAVLVATGWFKLHLSGPGLGHVLLHAFPSALLTACVAEVLFRGVVMGVFLRAMRPAAALGMSAAFFALVASVFPPAGFAPVDPEIGGAGFEMLRLMAHRFADGPELLKSFVPMLVLGLVLGYARWRTASLWLPLGMHAGWLSAKKILNGLIVTDPEGLTVAHAGLLQHMILPLAALVATGALAHFLTDNPLHPDAPRS
jgi:uncharacterized protein